MVNIQLEPSDYIVKFFVKNLVMKPRYQVVLLNDNLNFSVTKKKTTIEILHPKSDSKVKHKELIKGKVSNTKYNIYVFVHPLLTDLFWIQRIPSPPNKTGSWRSIAYFGTEKKGCGEFFEVVAIAAPQKELFKEGKQIKAEKFMNIIEKYPHSDIIVVERVCP